MTQSGPKAFYDREYLGEAYSKAQTAAEHSSAPRLIRFIEQHGLAGKRCLEVGAGRGAFQDLVKDYTGTDIADSARAYFHKCFHAAPAGKLPFGDGTFDALWCIAALEHISDPEKALDEMRRVLRHGGLIYLEPAWQCRPWAAQGYPVRPYRDFGLGGKLIKASIPLRDSVAFRSLYVFPRRLLRLAAFLANRGPLRFNYDLLEPNYEKFWMADSDAVNSMDPFDAILWFLSRGDACLSHPDAVSRFFVRTGALVFRIAKDGAAAPV